VKLALISEIHGNAEALAATLDDIAAHAADRIVCLGDIVGYNTKPRECIALLRAAGALCVAGSHDRAVSAPSATDAFGATAAQSMEATRKRLRDDDIAFLAGLPAKAVVDNKLIAVHGALHLDAGSETMRLDTDARRALSMAALISHPSRARICAFGHAHAVAIYERHRGKTVALPDNEIELRHDAYYLINPGAVDAPPGGDPRASYMMLDLARRTLAVRRVDYDAQIPFVAADEAGLAPGAAFLPASLRSALGKGLAAVRPRKRDPR
jgi:predicted phosphodiesterase